MEKKRAVSLIVLVITIIVMIILACAIILTLNKSGIIKKTNEAADSVEINNEKLALQSSIALAQSKGSPEVLKFEYLKEALEEYIAEQDEITVVDGSKEILVMYNKTNRVYVIEKNGNIQGPSAPFRDEYAGDLTKGGVNVGTQESPYVINCIEDLVEFSKNYATYQNSHVILARTLDFNSIFSYNNHATTKYGDLNGDEIIDGIKTELTKQGENCGGFTPIESFDGIFDGQNNKICNLYENRGENNAGLFLSSKGIIQNLGLENITLSGANRIGGIVVFAQSGKISNCFVQGKSKITIKSGEQRVGLIVSYSRSAISNCYSIGELEFNNIDSGGSFGGIAGIIEGKLLEKSYNIMDIKCGAGINAAGIAAGNSGGTIKECYHIGDIESGWKASGIGRRR